MPKTILADVDNAMMCGDLSGFGPADLAEAAIGAWELMWLADPHDILVMTADDRLIGTIAYLLSPGDWARAEVIEGRLAGLLADATGGAAGWGAGARPISAACCCARRRLPGSRWR